MFLRGDYKWKLRITKKGFKLLIRQSKLIHKILLEAKEKFKLKSALEVSQFVIREFKKHKNFTLEYFEIAEEETLLTCKRKTKNKKYRGFIAVFIEDIRLIDNISLK